MSRRPQGIRLSFVCLFGLFCQHLSVVPTFRWWGAPTHISVGTHLSVGRCGRPPFGGQERLSTFRRETCQHLSVVPTFRWCSAPTHLSAVCTSTFRWFAPSHLSADRCTYTPLGGKWGGAGWGYAGKGGVEWLLLSVSCVSRVDCSVQGHHATGRSHGWLCVAMGLQC